MDNNSSDFFDNDRLGLDYGRLPINKSNKSEPGKLFEGRIVNISIAFLLLHK